MTLAELEKAAVLQALRRFDDNRTRAATSLGISMRTLQRKLKRCDADNGDGLGYGDQRWYVEGGSPVGAV